MWRWQGWLALSGLVALVTAQLLVSGAQTASQVGGGTDGDVRQEWVDIGRGQRVFRVQVRQKSVPFAVVRWSDMLRAPVKPRSGAIPFRPLPGWENWRRSSGQPRQQPSAGRLFFPPPTQQPTLQTNFQGVVQRQPVLPPDTIGAAGLNHLVEFTNDQVGLFSKAGARLSEVALEQFFSALNPTLAFDPRVLYDQYSGRFIAICLDGDASPNSWIFLAVSETSDPTGRWFFWKIDADMDGTQQTDQWADFPDLGVDRDAIYITANMYPTTGTDFYVKVWVVPKAQLLTGQRNITWTEFSQIRRDPQGNFVGVLRAAHTFGSAPGEYLVSFYDFSPPVDTPIQVWRVTNPLNNPTFEHVGNIQIPTGFDQPPVPIPNNGNQANDFRLLNAVYQNGSVWTAHTIGLQNKSVARWYELDVLNLQLKQVGTIDQPAERWYYYPAVIANNLGDMVVSLSGSSQNEFPGVYFTAHLRNDPPGFTHPVQLIKAGEATYTLNRWGDYGGAALDPTDPSQTTFWVVHEYSLSGNRWGTWWGKVTVPPPVIALPNFSNSRLTASASEVEVGGSVDYTVQVVNTGNRDAQSVTVRVPNIPPAFAQVTVQDGGTFDATQREVRWALAQLRVGESATLRFSVQVAPDAGEGSVALVASISAPDAQTFTTAPAVVTIVRPTDPFEENNGPTQAHRLVDADFEAGTPTDGVVKRAYIDAGDEDWFRVSLPANRVYWLEVRAWQTGSRLNPQLRVYDANVTLLAESHDYLGPDPVVVLKTGSGGDFLVQVTADDQAAPTARQGTYRLVLHDITTSAAWNLASGVPNPVPLRAGEAAVALASLQNQGTRPQQVVMFNFPLGLRLLSPSQARFFGTPPIPLGNRGRGPTPNEFDWLLFIADGNEAFLADTQPLPLNPLNLGRLWVQEREGTLFFRVEFFGRSVGSLTDFDLTVDLDTDGNIGNGAEFQLRLGAGGAGVFRNDQKVADLAYLNLSERVADFGVALSALNNPTALLVRASLRDAVLGATDEAPDLGWARLTRPDPNQRQLAFGISPAAGTLPGGSPLTLWLLVDARTAPAVNTSFTYRLPASSSTLLNDLSQEMSVQVQPGPPALLRVDLGAAQVPATTQQVTVTVTVQDAAGNGAAGQNVRLTVSPTTLGNFSGAGTTQVTVGNDGTATATLTLTGQIGTLSVLAEVVGTSLTASQTLEIVRGEPSALRLVTTPPLTDQRVNLVAGSSLVLKISLVDGRGNPFLGTTFTLSIAGQPRVFTVTDGDAATGPDKLADEDRASDGVATVTLGSSLLGTQATTLSITVTRAGDSSISQSFTVNIQAGGAAKLVIQEPADLVSSVEAPLVRLVGDQMNLTVQLQDAYGNPVVGRQVTLTRQQGLSVNTDSQTTDAQGKATFTLSFPTPSTYQFWLTADGLRQPSDPLKTFRVQALPPLGDLPADTVRGLALPFFPPTVPTGQPLPSLSDLLGVPATALQGRVVRYDAGRQMFVSVNPANPIDAEGLGAGVGMFVKPSQTVTVRPQRGRLPDRDFVEIALQRGWNLIGFPVAVPFPWRLTNLQVRVGTTTRSLDQAADAVLPLLWRWDSAARSYRIVFDATMAQGAFESEVRPWDAYFIYAFQPCTLVVPVPIGARHAPVARRDIRWRLFTLSVRSGDQATTLVLGLSATGQGTTAPLPPAPESPVRAALVGDDGTPTGVALRPRHDRAVWLLTVQATGDKETVEVASENLAALPSDWTLWLVDQTTGERWSLRTNAWQATLNAGEERRLILVAEPRRTVPLRVQQVRVTPTRGRGALIAFTLTADARTEVAVCSLTGRKVRVLEARSVRRAGSHQVVWDGKDAQGQVVPPGLYLVRVRAQDDEGQQTQSSAVVFVR